MEIKSGRISRHAYVPYAWRIKFDHSFILYQGGPDNIWQIFWNRRKSGPRPTIGARRGSVYETYIGNASWTGLRVKPPPLQASDPLIRQGGT